MPKKTRIPFWPFGLLAFSILLAIDQYTKHAIASTYALGTTKHLFGDVSFTYVQNTGALWSILPDANGAFIWLSVIALGLLLYWHDTFRTTAERIALTLLFVGICGNLLDRLAMGAVIDFIRVGWWPIFNIADASINVGIATYLLEQWRTRTPRDPRASRGARSS